MTADQLEVGKVYAVKLDDCCIKGTFESRLVEIIVDAEPGCEFDSYSGATLTFENGVSLDTFGGCGFEEKFGV